MYRAIIRPALFCFPPETAHRWGMAVLRWATPFLRQGRSAPAKVPHPPLRGTFPQEGKENKDFPSPLGRGQGEGFGQLSRSFNRSADPRGEVVIRTKSRTLRFANPVGLAAGFDKDAEALAAWAGMGFGFVEVGTVTPRPQPGNPPPRLFRFPVSRALINRMGFNNAGAEALARRLSRCPPLGIPLGINIGKNKDTPADRAAEDYIYCLERLYKFADFFVVNISSPNTPGLRSLQSAESLEPLLKAIKNRATALALEKKGDECPRDECPPLFVKLSPDEEGYEEMVETVVRSGFDGIVATNTTRSREGVPGSAPTDGGLSGAPLRDRSTEVLRTIARASRGRLVLIGVGGIFRAEDALEKVLAGASLVEVYTGFVYNGPGFARSLAKRLAQLAARCGYETVQKAVGKGL
ncbi:MAG: quinone-dependent dihydroorotate dehydrogenase [Elusimicrobia bacterium]|nr:quinone-dependent dihydroorotate dehydrogenase [Elusimicrobiota bacterium]MBP9127516.1 quinone-dependent dihydroorotate dehydrogenase [Elusimicrobiota bacterium]